jgi:uncharacterized membrane protein YheB (UPF0754 family)
MTHWILLPIAAAGIGWFTNFLAVRMLFRPHRAYRYLGFTIQGLLPKRRTEFAANIAATVEEHLVSAEDFKSVLNDPANHAKLESVVRDRIDRFFDEKLLQIAPMVAAFLHGPLVDQIKSKLVDESTSMMSECAGLLEETLDESLDLKKMVEEKILSFDFHRLEDIVLNVARSELRWIELLGAILGFMVGLLQLLVLHFLGGMP